MNTKRKNLLVIMATCISIFLCMLDTTVMNIALPAIQSSLKVNLSNLSWALNIYTILFASLTIPLSKLADRFGLKRFYILGLIIFLIGSLISSFSFSLPMLIIGRGVQSIGAAIVFPLSMTIGINTADIATRKDVIAALGITQGLAAAMGPTIGGVLTQYLGWHYIFAVNVPFALISLLIAVFYLNRDEKKVSEKIDYLGSLLITIMLFSLVLALTEGREWGWTSGRIIFLFAIFVISFIAFLIVEIKAESPILPLSLFKNKEFTGSAIAIILSNLFLVAVTVIMPTYFTTMQHKSELEAALLITPIQLMIFIWSPLSAELLGKLGPRFIIASGFLLMALGYFLFVHLDMGKIYNDIISCLILGTGYGIIAGPITVLAASNFKGYLLTASQSSTGVLREVGVSLAVAIFLTGLYSNLSTAKTNSVNYVDAQVQQLNVPAKQKVEIKEKATAAVANQNSSAGKNDKVSKAQINEVVKKEYQKELKKMPANTSKQAKQSLLTQVSNKVNNSFKQIGKATNNIKNYAKRHYSNAFFGLYKISLPFVLLSTLSFLLFPSKKNSPSAGGAEAVDQE